MRIRCGERQFHRLADGGAYGDLRKVRNLTGSRIMEINNKLWEKVLCRAPEQDDALQ